MIVGPTIDSPVDASVDTFLDASLDASVDTAVAAALDAIEARLGAGEDPSTVINDVVRTLFGPGMSADERARIADGLLELLSGER